LAFANPMDRHAANEDDHASDGAACRMVMSMVCITEDGGLECITKGGGQRRVNFFHCIWIIVEEIRME